jgi:uncharacterized protein (DUF2062 family)
VGAILWKYLIKSVSVCAVIVAIISALKTMKIILCVVNALLMDITLAISNALSIGVDDGREIESGMKHKHG